MYQRRGKVRADSGRLQAKQVTGVALGSASKSGGKQRPEPAPPTSSGKPQVEMRRPSVLPGTYKAPEDEKERTKKQLESITGRMFQVLNDYEDSDDDGGYAEMRRKASRHGNSHNKEMKSNIQGIMDNYDQTSAEREELLESLADWFQQGHIDGRIDSLLGHGPSQARAMDDRLQAVDRALQEAASNGTPSQNLQLEKEKLERELAASGPGQKLAGDGSAATGSDAVTKSWKYAAMEIYGLLSNVRDTGVEEMSALEKHVHEMVATLAEQSQAVERLGTELQQQRELAYFSDMTTQELAVDNSDLREQLDRVRVQLVEAEKASTTAAAADEDRQQTTCVEGGDRGEVREKGRGDSGEGGKVEVYKAQIRDLTSRLAQLQEDNERLRRAEQEVQIAGEQRRSPSSELVDCSVKSSEDILPTHQSDHTPNKTTRPSSTATPTSSQSHSHTTPQSHSQTKRRNRADIRTDKHRKADKATRDELLALREQLQCVLEERRVMEEECRMRAEEGEEGKRERERLRERLQLCHCHSQPAVEPAAAAERDRAVLTPLQDTTSLTTLTTHTTHTTAPYTETMTTVPPTPDSTVMDTVAMDTVAMDTTVTLPTESLPTSAVARESVSMETTAIRTVTIETVTMDTVGKATIEEPSIGVLDVIADLVSRVNNDQADFIAADSAAFQHVHSDLQRVCDIITSSLLRSSRMVEEEANAMDSALDSLVTQLPEEDKPVVESSFQTSGGPVQGLAGREAERPSAREEMQLFAGQALQMIQEGEKALSSRVQAQQDKLQKVFVALQSHRQRHQTSITYPFPTHHLARAQQNRLKGGGARPRPNPDISLVAMGSSHDIHGNTGRTVTPHEPRLDQRQLPWKQLHQSTPHLPHSPTTHFPSLTTSSSFLTTPLGGHPHTSTTMAMFGDGGKGRQDGREKRRRQKPLHPRPKRSNFLQVSNTLSSPPPRTVPAGLRGVANSIGNHYHGNQTAHLAREGGVMPANETETNATFIDLLMQAPQVANDYRHQGNSPHSNRRSGAGGSIKLPNIL